MDLIFYFDKRTSFYFFNALGQEVMFGQTLELVDGLNKNQLDVQTLSAGLYLIHVQTKKGIQSKKLVVE